MLLCTLCVIGGGIGPAPPPHCRYVTQAEVILYQGQRRQTRVYQQPVKINSLLNYLRTTHPRGKIDTAQAFPRSHHYRITLHYCDGTQNTYYLQDYQYFCKHSEVWQKVSRTHAQLLYPLLQLLPPDL